MLGILAKITLSGKNYTELKDSFSIVCDVGFFTVDWICVKGFQIIDKRSGSVAMGVSQLLNALAQEIAVDCGEPFGAFQSAGEPGCAQAKLPDIRACKAGASH